jgi:hypothetical protein
MNLIEGIKVFWVFYNQKTWNKCLGGDVFAIFALRTRFVLNLRIGELASVNFLVHIPRHAIKHAF